MNTPKLWPIRARLHPQVFFGSAFLIILLASYAALYPEEANQRFSALQTSIIANTSWFYMATLALILITVAFLGLSRFGDIKLGPDHALPDYSTSSWFAMLFSAGIGIGLMFFGVAEPVMHFLSPPEGPGGSIDAARQAMVVSLFHWGLHLWATYAIVALILAFFCYRHGLPLTMRSALYPLIGERIHGPIGHTVDIFAILGTVFGVATSMGYGVLQINSGLEYLFGIEVSTQVQIILIIAVTALATLSVVTGLDKGIKLLSQVNMSLALLLLGLVVVLGPTVMLLQMLVQNSGAYLSEIVHKTFNLYAYEGSDWLGGWTLLYWGWALAWAPFVGMFIARISRGRTIRQFVTGVLFIPTGFTAIWMTVFGNTAIDAIMNRGAGHLAKAVQNDVSVALFQFLDLFPASSILSFIAILMVVVFFVTSADSGAMVVDMLASGGSNDTPIWQRVFWSSTLGIIASTLLLAGGLKALQTMILVSALPFAFVLIIATWGLMKALMVDLAKKNSLANTTLSSSNVGHPVAWQQRLHNLASFPRSQNVDRFANNLVLSAMRAVAEELIRHGIEAKVETQQPDSSLPLLRVHHGEEIDFLYTIRPSRSRLPDFSVNSADSERFYFRAEVFLREGGQNYDIMGWTREQVIADIVDQYEKHMHFLHLVR